MVKYRFEQGVIFQFNDAIGTGQINIDHWVTACRAFPQVRIVKKRKRQPVMCVKRTIVTRERERKLRRCPRWEKNFIPSVNKRRWTHRETGHVIRLCGTWGTRHQGTSSMKWKKRKWRLKPGSMKWKRNATIFVKQKLLKYRRCFPSDETDNKNYWNVWIIGMLKLFQLL